MTLAPSVANVYQETRPDEGHLFFQVGVDEVEDCACQPKGVEICGEPHGERGRASSGCTVSLLVVRQAGEGGEGMSAPLSLGHLYSGIPSLTTCPQPASDLVPSLQQNYATYWGLLL